MPDCCYIKGGKPSTKSAWSPVEDWDRDDVRQASESAEQEAALSIKFLVVDAGRNGTRRRCGWRAGRWVVSHHVGKLSLEGQGRVVKLVSILALSKRRDRLKLVL